MSRLPIFETTIKTEEGELIKVLTLDQQYSYRRNQSFVNPSNTPEAVPKYPVGYIELEDQPTKVSRGALEDE
jgi:hypothetical protein